MAAPTEYLRTRVRGQLVLPADEGYNAARKIYNAMIDKHPAMILRCSGAADVIAAVSFAQEHNLLVSIRSGGHGIAGKAVCDGWTDD
jgi:FAD/FMN-containing dehydrogenase